MNKESRIRMYGFLSRVFASKLLAGEIEELKNNQKLLSEIGERTLEWFDKNSVETIKGLLSEDFTNLFEKSDKPIESLVLRCDASINVSLQNPVMAFYYQHGYEMSFAKSAIKVPDHISIESAFMQLLIQNDDIKLQREFLHKHLGFWAPPYLLGIKNGAKTPFYRDFCDFAAEFIVLEASTL